MLSSDLSKAFDCVPRGALIQALQYAGVDAGLRAAILEVHERCRYHISHGRYKGSVYMKTGIRQGCALSPCRKSILTAWLHHKLALRTSGEWAQACATLFADDTHLQRRIDTLSDLEFCCHCIRETFAVFREAGMQVNSSKSAVVISLKGNAAKVWLRRHQQVTASGKWISVGVPHSPLLLPHAQKLYLGIVAPYHSFEMQTFQHRLQAARANKHRLVKVLHASGLSLKYRVRLYSACIRSSLTYSLHAVGYTHAVLHKLDQADARFLRAVAKSPSHLTHESTVALHKRLHIASPLEAAIKLVKGRATKCAEPVSRAYFERQREFLQQASADVIPDGAGLVRVTGTVDKAVACDECGQYFPNRQHLLSHIARKHPELTMSREQPMARDYTEHTVDGMTQCYHCHKKFTRVEGLKKHLRQACTVLHARPASNATAVDGDAASTVGSMCK